MAQTTAQGREYQGVSIPPVGTEAIALADTETELLRAGYQPPGSD